MVIPSQRTQNVAIRQSDDEYRQRRELGTTMLTWSGNVEGAC